MKRQRREPAAVMERAETGPANALDWMELGGCAGYEVQSKTGEGREKEQEGRKGEGRQKGVRREQEPI